MRLKFWVLLFVPCIYTSVSAQKRSSVDSVVAFKVYGNCDMCKSRIEKAVKGKGVRSATWDVDTKMLSLDYDPSATSPEKVQERIADAGHDTQLKTAKDFIYNELPDCCHYREKKATDSGSDIDSARNVALTKRVVTGVVMEMDSKGNFRPMEGAS